MPMLPFHKIRATTALCLAAIGMLCSCVQQLQEAREMDAKYEAYVKSKQTETPALTKLKQAAAMASRAQIRIQWSVGKEDVIIPLETDELAEIREIMPRMKDMPALTREAWDKMTEGFPLVAHIECAYLEFQNAQGEVMPGKLFLQRNIGVCEKAEEYSRDYLFYDDDYMLPEADRTRFLALPAITKALKH
jgi:hypothetical protein